MAFPPIDTVKNASVETSRAKKGPPPQFAKQSQGGEQLRNAMAAHSKKNPKARPPPFPKR